MSSLYLQNSDYAAFGLPSTLDASLVTRASILIDAHCHRPIAVTPFSEQLRLPAGRNRAMLSYTPIVEITSADGRYGYPRRGASMEQVFPAASLYELSAIFGGPPQWEAIDVTQIEIDQYSNTGEVWFPAGIYMAQYTDVRVQYTAGYATIPDNVKLACSQIIQGFQNRVEGVQSQRVGDMAMTFTRNASFITPNIAALLEDYRTKVAR